MLTVHQSVNGLKLVAKLPTLGAADTSLRWTANIESAVALLRRHGVGTARLPRLLAGTARQASTLLARGPGLPE